MKKLLGVLLVSLTLVSCSLEELPQQIVDISQCTQDNPESDCRIVGVWRNTDFQIIFYGGGQFIEHKLERWTID